MMPRYTPNALLAIFIMVLGGCAQPTPQVVEVVKKVTKVVAGTPVVEQVVVTATPAPATVPPTQTPEPKTFVTWFQYDQDNLDPKSDEHAGNEYLRKTIPPFNKAFKGKWIWDNQFQPWDRGYYKLVAAVQAKAEVPDIFELVGTNLNMFYQNGTLQDLTEWAKAQKWYAEIDPSALKLCTAPDGKLYCIPMAIRPSAVFVWKDRFPNGFPKTPNQFLQEGERLKAEGKYALTFVGSTANNGAGANRAVFQIVTSFGGSYDAGNGRLKLNTPENVKAIAWLREMVQKGYVPDIAFAGGFQEEQAFQDSSAGAFPTGLFGYRYLNPLTAPNGTKYENKNENDIFDAINAGDLYLAPMVAPEGKKPGCGAGLTALGIPVGAANVEAAHDFVNWLLTPEQNPAYVQGPGAGFPTLKSIEDTPQFQTQFYKEAAQVVAASDCAMPFPTVTDATGAAAAVMNVVHRLVKQDPTADIATGLQKAEDEFNKTVQ